MGAGDRTFRIYKFRTMCSDAEEQKVTVAHLNSYARNGGDERMFKAVDDPRVTRVGRFLRRYSLDEFPQLLNVFRGEMSLVGPGRSSSTRTSTFRTGPGAASSSGPG